MIFLVEDDDATRDAICILLECETFAVRGFASCDALCQAVNPGTADCLILDIHMQGMSGLDLLENLRLQNAAVPVVLMTGQLSAKILKRANAAGAFAVLEKPFRGNCLVTVVARALGARNAADAPR